MSASRPSRHLARVCLYAAGRLDKPEYYEQARSWAWEPDGRGRPFVQLNPDFSDVFIKLMQDQYEESRVDFRGGVLRKCRVHRMRGRDSSWPTIRRCSKQDYCVDEKTKSRSPRARRVLRRPQLYVTPTRTATCAATGRSCPICIRTRRFGNRFRQRAVPFSSPAGQVPPRVRDQPAGRGQFDQYPLLRHSDVLLMFAEADNSTQRFRRPVAGGRESVRRRAFGFDPPTPLARST